MKKVYFNLIILFAFLTVFTPVSLAENDNFGNEIRNTIRETVEEGKEASLSPKQIREEVRENVQEQVQEKNEGLLNKVKNTVKKNLRFNARITGEITLIGTNSMTVTGNDGKTYTVNITENTRLTKRFGGESELSEFSIGNQVNVFGKFTDEGQLAIEARLIRNLSIQKRWGAFFGTVTSVGTDSFVIKTIQRGDLTISYNSETEFLNHNKEIVTSDDIQTGLRVRVKGIWDKSSNEILKTEEVRIFPTKPTPTP